MWLRDDNGLLHYGEQIPDLEPGDVVTTSARDEAARITGIRLIPEFESTLHWSSVPAHHVLDVIWIPNTIYDKASEGTIDLSRDTVRLYVRRKDEE